MAKSKRSHKLHSHTDLFNFFGAFVILVIVLFIAFTVVTYKSITYGTQAQSKQFNTGTMMLQEDSGSKYDRMMR